MQNKHPIRQFIDLWLVLFLAALCVIFLPLTLQGQKAEMIISGQAQLSKENGQTLASPNVSLDGYVGFGDHWSVWGFAYASPRVRQTPSYVSMTVGPYFDLNEHLGCGVAAGFERFAEDLTSLEASYGRGAVNCRISIFRGSTYLDKYVEFGSTGERWQKTDFQFPLIMLPINLGVLSQTGLGTGPQFIYEVPRTPIRFLAVPILFKGGSNRLFAIEFVFREEDKK